MATRLDAIARYNELYSEYLKDMQKPKYSANPEQAHTDDLLRDLYKVVCGNGNTRKSIMSWSVDNGARLTIASEDMNAIQVTLSEHSARLKTQEDICLANRSIYTAKPVAEPIVHPTTIVNVAPAPVSAKSQSALMGFVQAVKNVKDLINVAVMVGTAIVIILGYLSRPTVVAAGGLTKADAIAIAQTVLAQNQSAPKKPGTP